MSYDVRSPELENKLRDLATTIRRELPPGYGFTLLIFSYGAGQPLPDSSQIVNSMFYISTANRVDMLQAMREFVNRNTQ